MFPQGKNQVPLPLMKPEIETNEEIASSRGAAADDQARNHRTRVLLIEDNPSDAWLIERMVTKAGGDLFEVEKVDRLAEGLKRLETQRIGLVLSDLSLPDSHGLRT